MLRKKVHFIGICGVAMSAIAIAFKKQGWIVTGSDAGFFPPISTHLEKNSIEFYPGWHVDKMIKDGTPDLVVVGNVASSSNPEWLYVQEHKLNFKSYPEVLAEYFIKSNSIVCAGTYGKTSTTALLAWILTEADFSPNYMFGGLSTTPPSPSLSAIGGSVLWRKRRGDIVEFPSAAIGTGKYSVVEGDEYKSARWDMSPKFSHYSPTHLLLTGLAWDHADVYPTEEGYFQAFEKLVTTIPKNGLIIACADSMEIQKIVASSDARSINYGNRSDADYSYKNVQESKDGISFEIIWDGHAYTIKSPMLGTFQAANITGAFAMANEIGIKPEICIEAIQKFVGMKRRLEKRFEGKITVFDDIAHSPAKAASTLQTLRNVYTGKIIAIFEPNTGNRRSAAVPGYAHAFAAADEIIIPELTNIKKDPNDIDPPMDGAMLRDVIAHTHQNVSHIPNDPDLTNHLLQKNQPGDVVVFLGSHGFRGMIEELVKNSN